MTDPHRLFLAAVATLALAGCAPAPQPLSGFMAHQGFVAVPLTKLRTGHETLRLRLNGVDGLFVLDSGAGGTVVHSASAAKFGLTSKVESGKAFGAGSAAIETSAYKVESFEIGNTALAVDRVVVLDLGSVVTQLKAVNGVDVDGVVGQDVLTRFKGVIDVGNQTLYLARK